MKAYYAWVKDIDPIDGVDVIFAENAQEAKKIAYKKGTVVREYMESFFDIRVRRCPEGDWWANFAGRPGVWEEFFWNDPCFMRDVFGSVDGCPECDCCGLVDTSELHPDPEARKVLYERWKVCPECGQCAECGHDEDCSQK